jgi:hypothetical protein
MKARNQQKPLINLKKVQQLQQVQQTIKGRCTFFIFEKPSAVAAVALFDICCCSKKPCNIKALRANCNRCNRCNKKLKD